MVVVASFLCISVTECKFTGAVTPPYRERERSIRDVLRQSLFCLDQREREKSVFSVSDSRSCKRGQEGKTHLCVSLHTSCWLIAEYLVVVVVDGTDREKKKLYLSRRNSTSSVHRDDGREWVGPPPSLRSVLFD